jgi:malonyl CoA-acyl carrier protein transacylase/phosphopantetheinyl transferase
MTMTLAQPRTKRAGERGSSAPRPEPAWETELFVLRGDDREGLRQRAQTLAAYLDHHPDVVLRDLAFTLNTDLSPGGSRLAVVAGSASDLRVRLARAGERLADPRCRQIRDTQGVYYFDEPMHPKGKLAVLFTGEGAQYLGMLGDLIEHFPEARAHFTVSDHVSLGAGRRRDPISRVIHLPPDASDEERAAAEKALWRLDNAVGAVLVSNWAIYQVLRGLGVHADAFAGHSSGEISALAGAGCLEADESLFAELFALSHVLRTLEDEGGIADTVLLAAGAGRKTVMEVIEQTGAAVYLAMDNCPHQTVLGGPQDAIAKAEEVLKARGILCERLSFRRPYHTPLFEPSLPPIAAMYERLPIGPPRTAVYSNVTAQAFPTDPAAIRRLSVANWAARVEFSRQVEAMYADGVRIFVESGPRGNLTAFVEDILRGRPCAAVPADLPRRKGLTQLNHLAGQLAAHHVPLDLDYLYRRRAPRRVAWEPRSEERKSEVASSVHAAQPAREAETPPEVTAPSSIPNPSSSPLYPRSSRAQVFVEYCQVMEQFLDLQRSVMEQFLQARGQRRPDAPAPVAAPTVPQADIRAAWPLIGTVVRHDPGRSMVLRRTMDLREDLYGLDHTFGGRHVSRIDPDLHGLPVMPMAFSIEMMAEAAAHLVPGKKMVGLERVRLHRWIALDADDPITLEVTVRLGQASDPVRVHAEIRNLGNSAGQGQADVPVVGAIVLLADRYPEPPPVEPFPLSGEGPCRFTPAQLYEEERRLFHGPLFQAVCATDRQGKEGIEGSLRTLPHSGLFRSASAPDLLTDPLLIDASTHLLGCWHLGQADPTGRVVFPYELGRLTLYGPRPTTGSCVTCRVRIDRETARQVSHRIDLIGADGRYWCRIEPAEYWRFYWPRVYTDYFRFKERCRVSQDWPAALAPAQAAGAVAAASARCLRVVPPEDLQQSVKRAALTHISLSRAEWQQFRVLKGPDEAITEWAFSRVVSKDAVRTLWEARHGEKLLPADFELVADAEGRWSARRLDRPSSEPLPAVSVAHAEGVLAALATFSGRPGIDLARVRRREAGFEEVAFDPAERALLDRLGPERDEWLARFWCARAAVARALGRGQIDGPQHLAVRTADRRTGKIGVSLDPRLAASLSDESGVVLIAWTVRDGDLVVATTFCEMEAS